MKRLFTFIIMLFAGYAAMAQCNPSFTYSASPSGNNLLNETFTNTTVYTYVPGQTVNYSINYGDGSSGYLYGTTNHNYSAPGTYTAVLTMTVVDSSAGNATVCSNIYSQNISIAYSPCATTIASSTGTVTDTSETINFTTSTPAGTTGMTYTWDFGDGTNGSGPTVSHTYASAGYFYVTVTATAPGVFGCTYTNNSDVYIDIFNCTTLSADFTYDNYSYSNVTFTNTSTSGSNIAGESLVWDFGDGSTSTSYYPTHTYAAAGTYSVILTVTWMDSITSVTCTHSVAELVTVGNPAPPASTISGYVSYVGDTILNSNQSCKVWLIQFDPTTNILSAVDSTTIYMYSNIQSYAFNNVAAGQYRTKAQVQYNTISGSGLVPTYDSASLYWSGAWVVNHAAATVDANVDIHLQTGIVTSGPGFVAGNVLSGANKGTDAGIPAVGMLVYLRNTTNNSVVAYQYTDVNGDYSFSNIPVGSYNAYPEAINYATTPYPTFNVTTGQATVNNVNFRQHTTDKTITPVSTAVNNVTANEMKVNVYPNPTNGQVTIQWQVATTQNAHVSIANVVGQKVFEENMNLSAGTGNGKLDLSVLKNGLYMMTIKSGDINYSQELVVQH